MDLVQAVDPFPASPNNINVRMNFVCIGILYILTHRLPPTQLV